LRKEKGLTGENGEGQKEISLKLTFRREADASLLVY
jgi:hypothetical protein